MYVINAASRGVWGHGPPVNFEMDSGSLLGKICNFCMVETESSFASTGSLCMAITARSEKHGCG